MSLWARFFQRAPKKPIISRKRPRITSYNNPERYEYSSRYESRGRDLYSGEDSSHYNNYGFGSYNSGGFNSYFNSLQQDTYLPRISHRGYWSQIRPSVDDEELVECLRVLVCTTGTFTIEDCCNT